MPDINTSAESAEKFINDLVEALRKKRWVKILLLIGFVFAILLNPPSVEYGLKFFGLNKPEFYSNLIWGIVVASLFVAAFLVALLTKEKKSAAHPPHISIIKGLLPYTNSKEDAEWFAKLQRGRNLQECLRFIGGKGRLAVLSGESGAGKTSFLQAGLSPVLESQGHHPIYVKITNKPPLDAIRQSIKGNSDTETPNGNQDLIELIKLAMPDNAHYTVLILDQFEQFFAHHKTKSVRKPFIRELDKLYRKCESLPIKIIISIRGDFANRLNEFQKEMKFTLALHNNLSLEKFEPQEAVEVVRVIAKEAEIELDEKFVQEFANELADNESKVSLVDIQIFSWLIDGQKKSEERAFNWRAFQKLGGIEGLLKRFLSRSLDALKIETQRQSAVKVMLALTTGNVRAGALSLSLLEEKLKGVISPANIKEAVNWLARPDVRLITETEENNTTLYELAHERIIQPLHQSFGGVEDVETAELTLDRRVNEWIGSNYSRKYLLSFKEWRLINRYWKIMTIGLRKKQKEEFMSLSKKRFIYKALGSTVILLLILSSLVGYKVYERRPETQIHYMQEHLLNLLDENNDVDPVRPAALLLATLNNEQEREFAEKLRDKINKLPTPKKARILPSLVEAYISLSKNQEALKVLQDEEFLLEKDDDYDDFHKARILPSMAEAYIKLDKNKEAETILEKERALHNSKNRDKPFRACLLPAMAEISDKLVKNNQEAITFLKNGLQISRDSNISNKRRLLVSLATVYGNLADSNKAQEGLDNVQKLVEELVVAEKLDSDDQSTLLSALAEAYANLSDRDKALAGINKNRLAVTNLDPAHKSESLALIAKIYGKFADNNLILNSLDEIQLATKDLDSTDKSLIWSVLAESYGKFYEAEIAQDRLFRIQQLAQELDIRYQAIVLVSLAEAHNRLSNKKDVIKLMIQAEESANRADTGTKNLVLSKIAVLYAKMQDWRNAHETTLSISNEIDAIKTLSKILVIWRDTKNDTRDMEILERILTEPGEGCKNHL
jgi:hypothetical protein